MTPMLLWDMLHRENGTTLDIMSTDRTMSDQHLRKLCRCPSLESIFAFSLRTT